jgi:hypothetical protein
MDCKDAELSKLKMWIAVRSGENQCREIDSSSNRGAWVRGHSAQWRIAILPVLLQQACFPTQLEKIRRFSRGMATTTISDHR